MAREFGFKGVEKKDFTDFEPKSEAKPEPADMQASADRTAERAGFPSREPVERVRRISKAKEPLDHAYVRAPVSVINRFKTYCNEEGISYAEALERLMAKSGI